MLLEFHSSQDDVHLPCCSQPGVLITVFLSLIHTRAPTHASTCKYACTHTHLPSTQVRAIRKVGSLFGIFMWLWSVVKPTHPLIGAQDLICYYYDYTVNAFWVNPMILTQRSRVYLHCWHMTSSNDVLPSLSSFVRWSHDLIVHDVATEQAPLQ